MTTDHRSIEHIARRRVPRRRGALTGFLVLILGAWGAIIPFVGPYFNYGYSPLQTWTWTAARGWLEVLPGAVAVFASLLLIGAASRLTVLLGAWLAAAAGAWFLVGPTLAQPLGLNLGVPVSDRTAVRVLATLGLFYALGALILFLAAMAIGRLSVRTVGDMRAAERRWQRAEDAAAAQPTAVQPTAVQPTAVQPTTVQPTTVVPDRDAVNPVAAGSVVEPTVPTNPAIPASETRGPVWGWRGADQTIVEPAADGSSDQEMVTEEEHPTTRHHRLLGRR